MQFSVFWIVYNSSEICLKYVQTRIQKCYVTHTERQISFVYVAQRVALLALAQ